MLKKLMRYDFKSVFKLWWIGAVSTLALSVIGGFISEIFTTERDIPEPIYVLAIFGAILVYIGFIAFAIFSEILVYLRFYKNLYTDEGYLTFTLPAKRQSILNSKVFLGAVTSILTGIVLSIDSLIVSVISLRKEIFTPEFLIEVKDIVKYVLEDQYYYYIFIYLVQALIIFALLSLVSILFAYGCITIASVIAKKAKLLVAIGIYYGATSVLGFLMAIFFLFGFTSLMDLLFELSELDGLNSVMLLMFMVIFILCAVCCLLYYVTHWCLDKKLNLA